MFRKVKDVNYHRERLELDDGDFLDLDWLIKGSKKLAIISHGLEGNSDRHYVKGMAKYFYTRGYDVLAWNCRSCGGDMNRLLRLYHHAASEDLAAVVEHAVKREYQSIILIGFSMGGSLSLKYIGEQVKVNESVSACTAFSVPCDLASSAALLNTASMKFYRRRFLKKLQRKLEQKAVQFPRSISLEALQDIDDFKTFDNLYTAPLHGFKDADDFYETASANRYLPAVNIPTLLVNAANDPFLSPLCYPVDVLKMHRWVYLEMPRYGGHVGFPLFGREENWMEQRAFEFAEAVLKGK
jgi:predicted alpha/beta-fold hydrolase